MQRRWVTRTQGLVRAGEVPTGPRSLERECREISHLGRVVQTRQLFFSLFGNFFYL